MLGVVIPTRWLRQPTGPVEIDWTNYFARGLAVYILPSINPVNLALKRPGIVRGSVVTAPEPYGMGFRMASDTHGISLGSGLFGNGAVTLYALARVQSSGLCYLLATGYEENLEPLALRFSSDQIQLSTFAPEITAYIGGEPSGSVRHILGTSPSTGANSSIRIRVIDPANVGTITEATSSPNTIAARSRANNWWALSGSDGASPWRASTGQFVGLLAGWDEREISAEEFRAWADNPYQVLRRVEHRLFSFGFSSGGGPQAVTVNQVTEADLAQSVAKAKRRAIAQAAENDNAQAVTRRKQKALGQTTETDNAQAVTRRKARAIGQALETDLARPVTATGQQFVAVGQVTETDTAQPVAWAPKRRLIARASEADAAQPVAKSKRRAVAQAVEIDAAQAVTRRKVKAVGQALETDLAQPVTEPGQLVVTVGQVIETDSARPIAWAPKRRLVSRASETDTAQQLTIARRRAIGQPAETDIAQPVLLTSVSGITLALEIDIAQPVSWAPKLRIVKQAAETDAAQAIIWTGSLAVRIASVSFALAKRSISFRLN